MSPKCDQRCLRWQNYTLRFRGVVFSSRCLVCALPRSAAFPASATEILLHICCFPPPAEHSAASSWLIYQVIYLFIYFCKAIHSVFHLWCFALNHRHFSLSLCRCFCPSLSPSLSLFLFFLHPPCLRSFVSWPQIFILFASNILRCSQPHTQSDSHLAYSFFL